MRADGRFVAGRALEGTTAATTVRVRAGKRLVSDGPFADTRERVVGYYLIEAADLDQAIALAARVPAASYRRALELAGNDGERRFLERRLREVG